LKAYENVDLQLVRLPSKKKCYVTVYLLFIKRYIEMDRLA